MRAGRGLERESAVRALVGEAPARVADLRDLGCAFDPDPGLEGGHSRRRVLHVAGAATGKEILRVLVDRVLEHPRIRVAEGEAVRAISRRRARTGVLTERRAIEARATLVATGGAASLWERTTNRRGQRATAWPWLSTWAHGSPTSSSCSSTPRCWPRTACY